MQYIRKPDPIKEKIMQKMLHVFQYLDNTGNPILKDNGELSFIKFICNKYRGEEFSFFDVGANKGEYTSLILDSEKSSKLSAHVFEPQASCFRDISRKFSSDKRIVLRNFGLSDKEGSAVLHKDSEKSGLASLYRRNLEYYDLSMDISEKITLKKASDYIRDEHIKKIQLIKIDIEGHELAALAGFGDFLTAENVDFIQFEYGGANLDSRTNLMELFSFFEGKGFIVCKIFKKHLEIRKYDPYLENFTYQNFVAVSRNIITSQS